MEHVYNPQELRQPLRPEEIEWRIASSKNQWTTIVPYLNARTVMDRLDKAFGPLNWQVTYREFMVGDRRGVLAEIKVRDPSTGEWITKADGAEPPDMESFKGGISGALKRAAVPWGIGRELYHYPTIMVRGEHKYIPWPVQEKLDRLVEAIIQRRKLPEVIRLDANGNKVAQRAA